MSNFNLLPLWITVYYTYMCMEFKKGTYLLLTGSYLSSYKTVMNKDVKAASLLFIEQYFWHFM